MTVVDQKVDNYAVSPYLQWICIAFQCMLKKMQRRLCCEQSRQWHQFINPYVRQ